MSAHEAPEAVLEGLDGELPHVMVIDYVLGGALSGGCVARELRSRLRTSCPPLILLSGTLGQVPDTDLARFDGVVAKGGDLSALLDEVLSHAAHEQSARSETVHRRSHIGAIGRGMNEDPESGASGSR